MNLPLLIKFVGHRAEKPLNELVLLLKDYGQESIVIAGQMLKEKMSMHGAREAGGLSRAAGE